MYARALTHIASIFNALTIILLSRSQVQPPDHRRPHRPHAPDVDDGRIGSGLRQGCKDIDKYNKLHDSDSADGRNASYVDLVNSYYNLATDFYEWGWGQSFHFAGEARAGERFKASIARHEYYLAMRLGVQPSDHVLDCGCGIGGPLRNIGQFTNARITGVTLNQYQVDRGNTLCAQVGLDDKCRLVQADFHHMPFEDGHLRPLLLDRGVLPLARPRRRLRRDLPLPQAGRLVHLATSGASPTSTTRTTLPTCSRT